MVPFWSLFFTSGPYLIPLMDFFWVGLDLWTLFPLFCIFPKSYRFSLSACNTHTTYAHKHTHFTTIMHLYASQKHAYNHTHKHTGSRNIQFGNLYFLKKLQIQILVAYHSNPQHVCNWFYTAVVRHIHAVFRGDVMMIQLTRFFL